MPKNIHPYKDVWYGVQDARKRKKIQDRLAQRARRQRLAKANREPETRVVKKQPNLPSPISDKKSFCITPPPETISSDHEQLKTPNITTLCNALFKHGLILNIPCGTSTIAKSSPSPPHVPTSLRSLELQQDVVHFSFIDRFPLPNMRRNMILLADSFSAEEFLLDIFSMDTFQIKDGKESWDETAWLPTQNFKAKWGFLLNDGVE